MEQGGHVDPGLLKPLAVLLGDFEVGLDETDGGDAPQADDDFGADQGHLVAQVADAGVLLGVQRVAVVGGTAFDHVGDVHVLVPAQVDELQHLVQQLAAPAHKGEPLQVLVLARPLSDAHDLRVPGTGAEYHMMACLCQSALLTGQALSLQFFPIQHGGDSSQRSDKASVAYLDGVCNRAGGEGTAHQKPQNTTYSGEEDNSTQFCLKRLKKQVVLSTK